jgi:hypothetical protein
LYDFLEDTGVQRVAKPFSPREVLALVAAMVR